LKVVFHIDLDSTPVFELALTNVINFLRDVGKAEVAFLANGFAVKHFIKESSTKFKVRLEELYKQGVKFYVCNNALNAHNIDREQIFDFCEVVPAGVTKLVELQSKGYAYIKP
jgi:hypothetical protein